MMLSLNVSGSHRNSFGKWTNSSGHLPVYSCLRFLDPIRNKVTFFVSQPNGSRLFFVRYRVTRKVIHIQTLFRFYLFSWLYSVPLRVFIGSCFAHDMLLWVLSSMLHGRSSRLTVFEQGGNWQVVTASGQNHANVFSWAVLQLIPYIFSSHLLAASRLNTQGILTENASELSIHLRPQN